MYQHFMCSQLVLLVLLTNTGHCAGQNRLANSTAIPNHKLFADEVKQASSILLYEGLPHQMFESDLLQSELKTKKTTNFGDFPFYKSALAFNPQDATKLTNIVMNHKSFRLLPQGVAKACGGFHPDYCIEWHVGKRKYQCLVCFGCKEVKVLGPRGEMFYCELTPQACKNLEIILYPYQKHRPRRNGI